MTDQSEMKEVEVLGEKYKLFRLPATLDETMITRLDEYIMKSQHNFEQFTLMLAAAREFYVEKLNAKERKYYEYVRGNRDKVAATILRDLAKGAAVKEIQEANLAEAFYKRYDDWKEVGLERLQTFKKLKRE